MADQPQKPRITIIDTTFEDNDTAIKIERPVDIEGSNVNFVRNKIGIDLPAEKSDEEHDHWYKKPRGIFFLGIAVLLVGRGIVWAVNHFWPQVGF